MVNCPNCGTQNEDGARFCAECGADLRSLASAQTGGNRTPAFAPQFPPPSSQQPDTDGNWQMPGGPPPVTPKGRKTWLWIVIGILAACLIICCASAIWASTDSGQRVINDLGTRFADQLTETAPTPRK